eukprot:1130339-Pyramimonas_sp.AAC.1
MPIIRRSTCAGRRFLTPNLVDTRLSIPRHAPPAKLDLALKTHQRMPPQSCIKLVSAAGRSS